MVVTRVSDGSPENEPVYIRSGNKLILNVKCYLKGFKTCLPHTSY